MISVRTCRLDEGQAIAAFIDGKPALGVEQHGVEICWKAPMMNWLIAENGAGIIGVVLLAIAPPIGIFESMVVDPALPPAARSRVVAKFLSVGYSFLRSVGCSAACCFIPDAHKAWQNMLMRRGAKVAYRGEMLVRQL